MNTSKPKEDRRIRRTRASLREALMELIVEKGYDAITVQDITDRANIARTTFYLHYKDKDELLFKSMRDVYEDIIESMHNETGQLEPGASADFEHVAEYAEFYKIMLSERGSMAFFVRVRKFLEEIFAQDGLAACGLNPDNSLIPTGLLTSFMAGAQLGIISWWLENNMKYSPETMGKWGSEIAMKGLVALGQESMAAAKEEKK